MGGHGSQLARKQDLAVAALMTERTFEDAARAADIGVATLRRWLRKPEFDAAFRQAKRQQLDQALARLPSLAGPAISALIRVMADQASPASSRVSAANVLLTQTLKVHQVDDLVGRILELERRAELRKTFGGGERE
jgi:hypothetical protein